MLSPAFLFLQRIVDMARVVLLMGLLLVPWVVSVRCDDDEEVLLALKKGISDQSGAMNNWVAGTGFCNWTGIQCDPVQKDRVQSISLGNREIHGTLTPLLGRLQYLTVLNFDLNNLTGSIPASLENCSRLTNISLGSNQLSGIIPRQLDRLRGLQRLDLWNNQLEGTIPASLGNCTMLDYLSLGQNYLSGSIPPELGRLGRLILLRLFTNNFVGSFPSFLTNCTALQIISLRNNSLTGSLPRELDRLVNLQQLRIQSNFFEGTLPPQIGNMTSLYYIDISSNRLTGNIPSTFGKLKNLQEMYLNNNSLAERIPDELANCQHLGTLDLSHNRLEGPLPDNIGDYQGLTNLTLDDNLITGRIPDSLGKLYRLINLDLSHNLLTGNLPSALASLSNIQLAFNLAYNSLDGAIPAWIGNLKSVQNISLQWNNFSGVIPASLGQCVGLNLLNLAGNQLVGPIPEQIGNVKALQKLDLSSNRLTGVIPSSLASLTTLVSLDVSMNQLEGPIPSNGQFRMFNLSSFQGNPGLCGAPVSRACDGTGSSNRSSSNTKTIVIAVCIAGFSFLIVLVAIWWYLRYRRRLQGPLEDPTLESDRSTALPGGPLIAFTPQALAAMTEEFNEENLIGIGGFSSVYKGNLSKDEVVAVKLLRLDMRDEVRKSFFAEIQTLGQVKHRNLVRLLGYCWTWDTKALVLEYMPNGSLQQHLGNGANGGSALDWKARFNVAIGVAQGISYLHNDFDSPIIHCDLKPANVLLDSDFEPHVADFGISRIAHPDEHASISAFRGSVGYAPPEYGSSTSVSTKGDVYSYGMLLLVMLTGKSPTSGNFGTASSLQQWVKDALPSRLLEVIDPDLQAGADSYEFEMRNVTKVALLCTSYVPSMRPTMQEVLSTFAKLNNGTEMKVFPSVDVLVNSPSPYNQRPQWNPYDSLS